MTETQKIVSRIFISGTIDAVWRELTKTHEPQAAMFNCVCKCDRWEPGGQIRMQTPDGKYTAVVGEILEFDPPHRYSHTMRFTQYDDPPVTVVYDLKEVEGGVEFTLTSLDVPVGTKTAKDMGRGGDMIVKTLKAVVETGKPPFGVRVMFVLFKLMAPFTPARSRSEHWPLDKPLTTPSGD